jgi:membrane protease YdiL (CAAX protease family)
MKLKGIYQSYSLSKQFFLLFLLIFVCFFVANLIGMSGSLLFGASSLTDLQNENTIFSLKFLQAWSSVGIFIVPPFLFAYLSGNSLSFKSVSRQQLMLTAVIMFFAMPLINGLSLWNEQLHLPGFLESVEAWMRAAEAKAMAITEAFLAVNTPLGLAVNILIIAIIPALGEELLFRGVIQKELSKWSGKVHLSIWITAFLFSAIHLQFLGFFPRFLIGGLLGYMFYWSGSIWLPILAHFVNNAVAVILYYMVAKGRLAADVETIGVNEGQTSMLLISFLSVGLLLYLLREISLKKA